MKTHTTTTLRILVEVDLDPAAAAMSPEMTKVWMDRLPEITEELHRLMNILVFSPVADRLLNRHFRQIQSESIYLINILEGYQNVIGQLNTLQMAVQTCLEQILAHIRLHHNQFFNLDLLIPMRHYREQVLKTEADRNLVVAALKGRNVDKSLERLIENSLMDFTKAGSCSYYRLAYMKALQESLTGICNIAVRDEVNEKLRELLFYNNLNTAAHMAYYKKEIQKQLAETFDGQEQQELLYAYQKQFKSWPQQRAWGFSPKNKGIKAMLLAYFKAEIKYRSQKLKVDSSTTPGSLPVSATEQNNYRLSISFSVDALAYFFKLLVKAGVVNASPKTNLLLFVSKSFQTPGIGTAMLSVKSLDNKYRQVVQHTAITVRTALVKMLKVLDEEFGG